MLVLLSSAESNLHLALAPPVNAGDSGNHNVVKDFYLFPKSL
jgi:hypothetical protein